MSTQALFTVEQFAQIHTGETEDFELLEGELIPLSSGTPLHADVRDSLSYFLRAYFREHPIGKVLAEIDCRLGQNTVRRADLSVFVGERIQQIDMRKIPIPFAPDIAVEVLSPSEAAVQVNRKIHHYLGAGCQEVWLFDADNGDVFVHANSGIRLLQRQHRLESPLLPGFSVPISELLVSERLNVAE